MWIKPSENFMLGNNNSILKKVSADISLNYQYKVEGDMTTFNFNVSPSDITYNESLFQLYWHSSERHNRHFAGARRDLCRLRDTRPRHRALSFILGSISVGETSKPSFTKHFGSIFVGETSNPSFTNHLRLNFRW